MMTDLRNLTYEQLEELIIRMGHERFRASQIFGWIYKGTKDFRKMHNLPDVLLQELEKDHAIGTLENRDMQLSSDGTRKFLFGIPGGDAIESVLMEYDYGNTACISSQAGCRMGCIFCASQILGLTRDLTAGEMISQIMDMEEATCQKVNNVVVMGTGEPLDNYEELSRFLDIMTDKRGRAHSARAITVSTCGIIPKMKKMTEDHPVVNLAISLHAGTDKTRARLMPINRKYGIEEVVDAARGHAEATGRRVSYEYALIRDVNDTREEIDALISLLRQSLCHVNLIPLNSVAESPLMPTDGEKAKIIRDRITEAGIPASIRRKMGTDIAGACGQLRLEKSKISIE